MFNKEKKKNWDTPINIEELVIDYKNKALIFIRILILIN